MFRCKECQAEYEIKPDYCDCGNDVFEEILPQVEQPKQNEIPQNNVEKVQKEYKKKRAQKPFFEPVSTVFFVVCVILSFVVVFFVGNPKEQIKTVAKKEPLTTNIPNLDKFWDNTPVVEKQVLQPQEQPVQVVEVQKQVQPQMQFQPKSKQEDIQKPVQQKQVVAVPQKVSVSQPKSASAKTVSQPQTVQPAQQVAPKTKSQTVSNNVEILNYKIKLRNKIANKINFANVIGDGSCVVSFSISNSGVLQNRKFKKQSENFTLNDVVYNAVMQTPSYNPPPAAYNGETMNLTVKMHNGNFEVTLN